MSNRWRDTKATSRLQARHTVARRASWLVATGALSVAVVAGWAGLARAAAPTVMVTMTSDGPVLTDAAGLALYTLATDTGGTSTCTGSCAQTWPPLTVASGTTPTAGAGVSGTVSDALQPGGTYQVSYNGSLLYTFVGDTTPGEVSGNGVAGFSVVKVTAPTSPSTTTPTTAAPTASTPTTAPAHSAPTTAAGTGTVPSAVVAGSSGAPSVPSVPSSLAFTGTGTAMVLTAIIGAVMALLGAAVLVTQRGRRWSHRR